MSQSKKLSSKEYLKTNHEGKKFMEVETEKRNTTDFRNNCSKVLMTEIVEAFGADEAMLYLQKDGSTFTGFSNDFCLNSEIVLFRNLKERLMLSIPSDIASALYKPGASDSDDESKGGYREALARAMASALEGLPEKYKVMAYDNIERDMKQSGIDPIPRPKSTKASSEDDLLDELMG